MAPRRSSKTKSASPVPTTETNQGEQNDAPGAGLRDEQWEAMDAMLRNIYAYRAEDGYDPTKLFQRKVNKRVLPGYYDVIKEPMALSMIKHKLATRDYKDFSNFVRDFALIPHNAFVYNVTDSQAYQDALVLKATVESELKKIVDQKLIDEETAKLPYLGEIPEPDEEGAEGEEEAEAEQEEEEEEDEDEEEPDESEDEGAKRKRKRSRPSNAAAKRDAGAKDDTEKKAAAESDLRKRRGRPPRVDTPMEARIKAIMKGLRKPKNAQNQAKISHFERLPDKAVMPEYFNEIKTPIAMDVLKKKLKRKKYNTMEQFMKDVETMFENAKQYNLDDSQIYKDAVDLQSEARDLAEQEKKRPDTDYVMEDGRLPMPDGILHNGELWKVGDWVHIQNPNDLTKPIVAQVYRTWQDAEGGKWVNACWYYRPEQTVHRFDRHFFENEVVKTGQYRDHRIDEVIDRCFVMFFTRFNKGRPRGFPPDKEIYVCEARYNEEKHKLNKIKTWASCLPDEVREKDYEMDLFDAPKKMKKIPTPIAYLLKDDAKETDDLPKPEWGADNAPPKIGAVHKRPRDPKDSPPPEPTPSPPPQPPPPPPRQPSSANTASNNYAGTNNLSVTGQTPASASHTSHDQQHTYSQQHTIHNSASPAPLQPMPVQQGAQHAAMTPHGSYNTPVPSARMNHTPSQYTPHHHQPHPPATLQPSNQHSHQTPRYSGTPTHPTSTAASSNFVPTFPPSAASAYPAPVNQSHKQPFEVYVLADQANASIPPDVRRMFQCDDAGRVLFFTAPPTDAHSAPPAKEGAALGHSPRYLAEKARRAREKAATESDGEVNGRNAAVGGGAHGSVPVPRRNGADWEGEVPQALQPWIGHMFALLEWDYKALYGEDWRQGAETQMNELARLRIEAEVDTARAEKRQAEVVERVGEELKRARLEQGFDVSGA